MLHLNAKKEAGRQKSHISLGFLSTFRFAQGYARKRPSCFTDKGSIFIDVSVNGRVFAKCSA